jgi:hypothetical protein
VDSATLVFLFKVLFDEDRRFEILAGIRGGAVSVSTTAVWPLAMFCVTFAIVPAARPTLRARVSRKGSFSIFFFILLLVVVKIGIGYLRTASEY